jgi:hypothetical protein
VLVGGRQWRPWRGSGARARKDGVGLLYPGVRWLGVPCAPRPRGQGMGGGTTEYVEAWAVRATTSEPMAARRRRRPARVDSARGS